ncbi:MAG TPA: geranylgeranyl reductase family protein [Acidobacteriaceae bacterium]|jgi:geranylgeranyl reductase family protein|nr:geranylgeranyl reductase family protein [Acidobacteriaceae bacterium]
MQRWDAIVVGAGPAGCAAAYDLAAASHAVLLLDRAEFPRHKACAGGLTRKTLRALRYSVAPVTREVVSAVTVERRSGEAATLTSRNPVCAMTVRQELDDFCLRKTLAAGAQFARIGTLTALEAGSQGVTVATEDTVFRSSFVVGADGVHSRVRQLLCGEGPKWFRRGFALEAQVRVADQSPSDVIFDFGPVRRGYAWSFPKRDHLNVGMYTEAPDEKIDRSRLLSWIAERFDGAASVERITGQYLGFGAEGFEAESARPAEGRVFLVGDAGGFADPLTGEGIYEAVASGQAAAAAIDTALLEGASAAEVFALQTLRLRRDLRLSASGARWFYSNFDLGFRALTAPVFRGAVINAYANGTKIATLANAVRRFARTFANRA